MASRIESPAAPAFTVLVVDDELSFLEAMREFLHQEGHGVVAVDTAEQALDELARARFDVAFVDLRLPGMGGAELLSRIKETWPEVEVVVVSAYASLESAVHAIRKQAFDYLLKPIDDLNVLSAVLRRVAEKRRMEADQRRLVEQLSRRNSEIQLLVEWGHSLADSLLLGDATATAIAGLSALGGEAPAAVYLGDGPGRLRCLARSGAAAEEVRAQALVVPTHVATTSLAASAEVRDALHIHLGWPVRMLFPLPLGSGVSGLLVLGEPGKGAGVSDETLNHFAGQVTTAVARALAYERISESTYRDSLTNLYNHRYLRERLVDEIARARRYDRPLSLAFLDIDGFKRINDVHGHLLGDRTLVTVAAVIRSDTKPSGDLVNRASDVPIRYGGDEFVLLLPETGKAGALIKAERVRDAVARSTHAPDGKPLAEAVTISIGVAEFPADGSNGATLIEAADRALYQAKNSGRNRVVAAGGH